MADLKQVIIAQAQANAIGVVMRGISDIQAKLATAHTQPEGVSLAWIYGQLTACAAMLAVSMGITPKQAADQYRETVEGTGKALADAGAGKKPPSVH